MTHPATLEEKGEQRPLANRRGKIPLLAEQILAARMRLLGSAVDPDQKVLIRMLESSLCMSYIFWSGGLRSGTEVPGDTLVCEGCNNGGVRIWFRGAVLPLDVSYVKAVLDSADVLLAPGQLILVDQELADDFVGRSLNDVAADIAENEKEQAELQDVLRQCDKAHSGIVRVAVEYWKGEAKHLRSRRAQLEAAQKRFGAGGGGMPGLGVA